MDSVAQAVVRLGFESWQGVFRSIIVVVPKSIRIKASLTFSFFVVVVGDQGRTERGEDIRV